MRTYVQSGDAASDAAAAAAAASRPMAVNLLTTGEDAPSKGVRYKPLELAGVAAISTVGFAIGAIAADQIAGLVRSLRD